MKKFSVLAIVMMAAAPMAFAEGIDLNGQIQEGFLKAMIAHVQPFNVINWKVGDEADYSVSASFLKGTMIETVTKDEGDNIWIREAIDLQIQKQTVDTELSKIDGHVIKMLVNGQEQQVPTDKPTIISQDYTSVTVPAGTFKVMHIVAKTQQVSHMEMWANPALITIEGMAKMTQTQNGMDITMELTSMKRAQ